MAIFELNPGSDLRFPTRKEVENILQDLDTEYFGWADTSQYKLASRFFPINAITATELELYAVKHPYKSVMTYFHAPGTEPRTWSKRRLTRSTRPPSRVRTSRRACTGARWS